MNNFNFQQLTHAISYFLSYQDKIGRTFMIDESTLKYPIADLLTSKRFPVNAIKLEYTHPQYLDRSIDLVISENGKPVSGAFEFKLAKPTTIYPSEKQRIFNDIARMYAISKTQQCPAFLLIAGKEIDFIQKFRSISSIKPIKGQATPIPAPQGFYTEWFEFYASGTKIINLSPQTPNDYDDIYAEFDRTYQQRKGLAPLILPATIQTTCLAISALSRDNPTPYVAGLWQIHDVGATAASDVSY